jgi:flagellar assembly factor FliW
MNCVEITEPHLVETPSECLVTMPLGLLGFEQFKRFSLVSNPGEEPFLWFQALDEPHFAFLAVSPFFVQPGYQPEIPDPDAAFLELRRPQDALIFNLVTIRGPQRATINLKGPIVLNRHTLLAKQVIPVNASDFSVEFPLPVQPD